MTPEQLSRYRQTALNRQNSRQQRLIQRQRQARQLAERAALLLKNEFAVAKVVLYGSLAREHGFHERSDIDLAVAGLAVADFFRAWIALEKLSDDFEISLADLDLASRRLLKEIEQTGIVL